MPLTKVLNQKELKKRKNINNTEKTYIDFGQNNISYEEYRTYERQINENIMKIYEIKRELVKVTNEKNRQRDLHLTFSEGHDGVYKKGTIVYDSEENTNRTLTRDENLLKRDDEKYDKQIKELEGRIEELSNASRDINKKIEKEYTKEHLDKIKKGLSGRQVLRMSDASFMEYLYYTELDNSSSKKDAEKFNELKKSCVENMSKDFDHIIEQYMGHEQLQMCKDAHMDPLFLIRIDGKSVDDFVYDVKKSVSRPSKEGENNEKLSLMEILTWPSCEQSRKLLKTELMSTLISGGHKIEMGVLESPDSEYSIGRSVSVTGMKDIKIKFSKDDDMKELETIWRKSNKKNLPDIDVMFADAVMIEHKPNKKEKIEDAMSSFYNLAALKIQTIAEYGISGKEKELIQLAKQSKKDALKDYNEVDGKYTTEKIHNAYMLQNCHYEWNVDNNDLQNFYEGEYNYNKTNNNARKAQYYLDQYDSYQKQVNDILIAKQVYSALYDTVADKTGTIFNKKRMNNMLIESGIRRTREKFKGNIKDIKGSSLSDRILAHDLLYQNYDLKKTYEELKNLRFGTYYDSTMQKQSIFEDDASGHVLDYSVLKKEERERFKNIEKAIEREIRRGEERANALYKLSTKGLEGEEYMNEWSSVMYDYNEDNLNQLMQDYTECMKTVILRQSKVAEEYKNLSPAALQEKYVHAQSMVDVVENDIIRLNNSNKSDISYETKAKLAEVTLLANAREAYGRSGEFKIKSGEYTYKGYKNIREQNNSRMKYNRAKIELEHKIQDVRALYKEMQATGNIEEVERMKNMASKLFDDEYEVDLDNVMDYIPSENNPEQKNTRQLLIGEEGRLVGILYDQIRDDVAKVYSKIDEKNVPFMKEVLEKNPTSLKDLETRIDVFRIQSEAAKSDRLKANKQARQDIEKAEEEYTKYQEEYETEKKNIGDDIAKYLDDKSGYENYTRQQAMDIFFAKEIARADDPDWNEEKEAVYQKEIKELKDKIREISTNLDEKENKEKENTEKYKGKNGLLAAAQAKIEACKQERDNTLNKTEDEYVYEAMQAEINSIKCAINGEKCRYYTEMIGDMMENRYERVKANVIDLTANVYTGKDNAKVKNVNEYDRLIKEEEDKKQKKQEENVKKAKEKAKAEDKSIEEEFSYITDAPIRNAVIDLTKLMRATTDKTDLTKRRIQAESIFGKAKDKIDSLFSTDAAISKRFKEYYKDNLQLDNRKYKHAAIKDVKENGDILEKRPNLKALFVKLVKSNEAGQVKKVYDVVKNYVDACDTYLRDYDKKTEEYRRVCDLKLNNNEKYMNDKKKYDKIIKDYNEFGSQTIDYYTYDENNKIVTKKSEAIKTYMSEGGKMDYNMKIPYTHADLTYIESFYKAFRNDEINWMIDTLKAPYVKEEVKERTSFKALNDNSYNKLSEKTKNSPDKEKGPVK